MPGPETASPSTRRSWNSSERGAGAMDTPAVLFSPSGRIAPKAFAIGIVGLYVVSFGSRLLLAQPVMVQAGVAPFVLVQIAVIWSWYALHAKRLHDAARS